MMNDDDRRTLFRTEAKVNLVIKKMNNIEKLNNKVTANEAKINTQKWFTGAIFLILIGKLVTDFIGK